MDVGLVILPVVPPQVVLPRALERTPHAPGEDWGRTMTHLSVSGQAGPVLKRHQALLALELFLSVLPHCVQGFSPNNYDQ